MPRRGFSCGLGENQAVSLPWPDGWEANFCRSGEKTPSYSPRLLLPLLALCLCFSLGFVHDDSYKAVLTCSSSGEETGDVVWVLLVARTTTRPTWCAWSRLPG